MGVLVWHPNSQELPFWDGSPNDLSRCLCKLSDGALAQVIKSFRGGAFHLEDSIRVRHIKRAKHPLSCASYYHHTLVLFLTPSLISHEIMSYGGGVRP